MFSIDKNKFEEVVVFIEKMNNITLLSYQKQMLKWMVEGYTFSSPIRSGRKLVLQGYISYLQEKHSKHVLYDKTDKHITLQEVCDQNNYFKKQFEKFENHISFKQEYECDWVDQKQEI